MQNLLKRKSTDLEDLRNITDDVRESDYVPYACHIDPHTILTKNGELLQCLKITGFTYEDIRKNRIDLRSAIRHALSEALENNNYAIWLHTIRRKASLTPPGEYPHDFSRVLNAAWRDYHDWDHKFVNEVYITVVREGESAEIRKPTDFLNSLLPAWERKRRWGYLSYAEDDLTATVNRIAANLLEFGVKKLGLIERNGVIYSEPVSFLGKLTSLIDETLPLPDVGLADYLTTHDVTFGFNAMEVRNPSGRRRFGAMLTLKEYKELSPASVDLLLQLPAEFMVAQCMDFINHKKALQEYQDQQDVFKLSGEDELPEYIGLTDILSSDHHRSVDFGEQQMNLFVIGDSVKQMEENVRRVMVGLNGLGLVAIREDIKLQEAYWAQLPANFEFLRRLKPINTSRIGGFAMVNSLPAGLAKGSSWGPPITVMPTAVGTPYFFNFHIEGNGHTAIVGPYGAGKTVLLNFLLSESRKLKNRLFFFDHQRSAEVFLRSIGAEYHTIDVRVPQPGETLDRPNTISLPKLNPLQLEDTPQNRSFLLVWLDAMLRADRFYRPEMSEEFWPFFQNALDYAFTQPREKRALAVVMDYLREHAPKAAAKIYSWHGEGEFARWFDHVEDTLDLSHGLVGFELGPLALQERAAAPVIAYLLHRVLLTLDGAPTIIVLDEAWELLDNPVFASRIGGWFEMLRSKNALAILATEKPDVVLESRLSPTILKQVATQVYLPNPGIRSSEYSEIFGLTTQECQLIARMSRERRQFLLKRGHESIVVEVDLKGLPVSLAVLSASASVLALMDKTIVEYGIKPKEWLPSFLKKLEASK